jgi:hypothetical protein
MQAWRDWFQSSGPREVTHDGDLLSTIKLCAVTVGFHLT